MTINVSSKGTVIFLSIKLSDIWKLTPYIMYNIEIHKVLNGPKIKIKLCHNFLCCAIGKDLFLKIIKINFNSLPHFKANEYMYQNL